MMPGRRWAGTHVMLGLLVWIAASAASAAELREARVRVGGALVLANPEGTVRLEGPHLDALDAHVFAVPEPCAPGQSAAAMGALAWIEARRRRGAGLRFFDGR